LHDSKESPSGQKTQLGAILLTRKTAQAVRRQSLECDSSKKVKNAKRLEDTAWSGTIFVALKNAQAVRRQSLERVVFMTLRNASGPKTRLGKKFQCNIRSSRKSNRSEDKTLKGINGTALTERFMVSNGC
jgi:hypothetical protein